MLFTGNGIWKNFSCILRHSTVASFEVGLVLFAPFHFNDEYLVSVPDENVVFGGVAQFHLFGDVREERSDFFQRNLHGFHVFNSGAENL